MRKTSKKLLVILTSILVILNLFIPLFSNMTSNNRAIAYEDKVETLDDGTVIKSNGCLRVIEKTEKVEWSLPRKPIDLVILQDASGSFKNTIGSVQGALKNLTTFVSEKDYDENNPRLVKTSNPDTTDRVMVATFQGLDGILYYSDNNFKRYNSWRSLTGADAYQYRENSLTNNQEEIHNFIDNIRVNGGTPTVPAIDTLVEHYENTKGNMKNERKTVYLVITDGVANGYKHSDGNVYIDESLERSNKLLNYWRYRYDIIPEGSQDYLTRAKELKEAGTRLKSSAGENGTVVVGFWEDVPSFEGVYQYGTVYKNGFAGTGIDTGDSRPVQEVFHEALQTVSSPSKLVNGKMADFYVNEQKDIEAFSSRILSAVGSALVKENISGNFQVTDGYKVDAVRINEKTVVSEVTDSKKQIKGTVSQNGNNVTISVPESVFNPGENKFDYDLSKSIKAEEVNEDDEAEAPDDYTPAKEKVVLPQLTGKFKVGNYETTEIGSKTPTSIEVDEIKYCYPITKKSIADNDKSNDVGEFDDPVVKGKKAYEADLTTANENFTYTIDYSYYNTPFLFKENVMLVDPLDYRLEYVSAKVTDETGKTLSDYKIRTETKQDSAGNDRTVVVADVPKKENSYNHLIFKKVKLVVEAKIKEKYQTLSKDYIKLIQDNEGHGALDQASIMWNGSTDPNPNEHEKNGDNPSTIRRSNTVYVKPPVDTDITKAVNDKEHADLASVEEEFTYTVKSAWPGVADSYVLEDTVVDELEVVKDSISVTIGGRDYTKRGAVANLDGQTVKMSLDKETIAAINKLVLVRKPSSSQTSELADVVLTFKSKVRKGANLSKYITNDVIKIPNKAKVILNNNPKDSNEVTVTPPKPPTPSTPPIEKKVNGKEHADLETRGERFTYTIKTQVPENASAFKITDKLVDELDFVGEIEAKVDGKDIEKVVTTGDKKLEVELSEEDLKLVGKEIVITFKAEIKDGVDLSKYATNEGVKVPNVAKYEINNDPQYSKETKPVTVTPPQPPIEKKVNGETHADLKEIEDKFSYEIKTKVAEGASEFKVEDTLVDELEFTGETKATVDGTAVEGSRITKEGQKITLTLTEEEAKKAGKEVVLTFEAKIKDGADLTKYVKEGKVKVPNKGEYTYKIPNNPKEYKKPSNEVTVTPPPVPTQPPVEKKVNGKEHADLGTREEEFTYTIKTQVPEKASAFKVTDILVDELQFVGEVEAKVDGKAIEGSQIKKDGQKLEVELSEENLKQEGKEIVVTFKAKIKDGADLSKYETKDGTKVPNVAKYEINNNPKYTKETPPVTVTPPPSTPETPTKKINNTLDHLDIETGKDYNYNIKTKLPLDITSYKRFVITDTLDDRLVIKGTPTITGDAAKYFDVKVEGQTVTAIMKDMANAKDFAGKEVELVIVSQIKEGAVPGINIPNTTKVTYQNKAHVDGDPDKETPPTPPVTVTPPKPSVPPTPKIPENPIVSKKINKNLDKLEIAPLKDYEYNITAKIPAEIENYSKYNLVDKLDNRLQIKSGTKPYIVGEAAKYFDVVVNGQTVTAIMKDFEGAAKLANEEIELVINAQIKEGAAAKVEIPNTVDLVYNDTKVDTEVVPTVTKKINGTLDKLDINHGKVYQYNIKTVLPQTISTYKEFVITDNLDERLSISGTPSVTGEAAKFFDVVVSGNTVKATMKDFANAKQLAGKEVELVIPSSIKVGQPAGVPIPNTTKVVYKNKNHVDGSPSSETPPTPPVVVTPPPVSGDIIKKVNNKYSEKLSTVNEVFTYTIDTVIPKNATENFVVTDDLENVLAFSGAATATVNGEVIGNVTLVGQQLKYELKGKDVLENAGKKVHIEFKAHIKAGADLSAYKVNGLTSVPNVAAYKFDNNPKVNSNVVPVIPPMDTPPGSTPPTKPTPPDKVITPPPVVVVPPGEVTPPPSKEKPPVPLKELPPIEKLVNGKSNVDLKDLNEQFTYTIKTKVAESATKSFVVEDRLVDELQFVGEVSARVGGKNISKDNITINGQLLTVNIPNSANVLGQDVVITFKAKIRANADLSKYKSNKVPNTAKYIINNNPKEVKESNTVTVTPPPTKERPPKGKTPLPNTGDNTTSTVGLGLLLLVTSLALRRKSK